VEAVAGGQRPAAGLLLLLLQQLLRQQGGLHAQRLLASWHGVAPGKHVPSAGGRNRTNARLIARVEAASCYPRRAAARGMYALVTAVALLPALAAVVRPAQRCRGGGADSLAWGGLGTALPAGCCHQRLCQLVNGAWGRFAGCLPVLCRRAGRPVPSRASLVLLAVWGRGLRCCAPSITSLLLRLLSLGDAAGGRLLQASKPLSSGAEAGSEASPRGTVLRLGLAFRKSDCATAAAPVSWTATLASVLFLRGPADRKLSSSDCRWLWAGSDMGASLPQDSKLDRLLGNELGRPAGCSVVSEDCRGMPRWPPSVVLAAPTLSALVRALLALLWRPDCRKAWVDIR
jgi:hypothetical protein